MDHRYGLGLSPFSYEPSLFHSGMGPGRDNVPNPVLSNTAIVPVTLGSCNFSNAGGASPQSSPAVGVSVNISPNVSMVVETRLALPPFYQN